MATSIIEKKMKVKSIDVTSTDSDALRIDTATSQKVTVANFLNAMVIGTNNVHCRSYTYSGYPYVRFLNTSTSSYVSGTYTVRIFYFE